MLLAILKKFWIKHTTKQQLYGHLPSIMKTIQVRRTRHAGHCWRSRDKLIRNVLMWISSHGRAKTGRPASTYIQQLCANSGCSLEDLLETMDDSVRENRADGIAWGWRWRCVRVCVCVCVCVRERERERERESNYQLFGMSKCDTRSFF